MRNAGIGLLLLYASASQASADVVGTLNVHTAPDGHRTTGLDSGQPVAVQVDFSGTQDGSYDITVWSGEHQFGKITRVDDTEGSTDAGFNTVELTGSNPSPTPAPRPVASPADKP